MHPTRSRGLLTASWLLSTFLTAYGAAVRPNFVFILTDDQDNHMGSLDYMPSLQKHLVEKGTLFEKHYCSIAICCPSRVSLWTGQLAHNTNVTNVNPPWGGYPKFVQNGFNDHHLALWLERSGYNTYYAGKLFNAHTIYNYNSPPVSGYTQSNFFLDPYTYQYYNVSTTKNGQAPTNPVGKYSTDIVAESASEFLDHALRQADNPFFITLAPIAPHALVVGGDTIAFGPPEVAKRHEGLFQEYKIPRTPNFNPESPSGVNWVSKLPRLNETVISFNDEYQRNRLRALQAVDEMIEEVVNRLDKAGVLDNTFIIYTTDNGYHISQHRLHPGKTCGFETDINVPLVIRGPGVPVNRARRDPTSHVDLAPTILQLSGDRIDDRHFDGAPIDLWGEARSPRSEHVAVEFWGFGLAESHLGREDGEGLYLNNTYKGLRIEAEGYGFYYSVWCNNEKELYDMKEDPGQLRNLLSSKNSTRNEFILLNNHQHPLQIVVDRLDALMMVVKSCKEQSCRDPWRSLHPNGDVSSLEEALSPEFDAFYRNQVKVSFVQCEQGYILSSEGPQNFVVFGDDENVASDLSHSGAEQQRLVSIDPNWSLWE